jgi:hypothetical protein
VRQSDGKKLDIGVVQPVTTPVPDAGGYADASAQDSFCANTYCWISKVYDQSPKHNDLTQAPRGGFSGPAMGGFNNLPVADMAPATVMGHKVYGIFIVPGMGLRDDDPKGTAVDDQAEGQYWVINGLHFNSGCCFDYGNAEIDSRDDDNGTMETTYYGDTTPWYHGNAKGPWIMTDQENNLVGCVNPDGSKLCASLPNISWRFVTAMAKGEPHHWTSLGGDAQRGDLSVMFDGPRVDSTYDPMRKQGAILLGNGGDNSNGSQGTFYEGAMTAAGSFPSNGTDQLVQANIVAAHYAVSRLSLAPVAEKATPPGVLTFSPGSSKNLLVTFTNLSDAPVRGLELSLSVPDRQWTSLIEDTPGSSKMAPQVAPGASVSKTFKVTSGPKALNGDMIANASWTNVVDAGASAGGARQTEKLAAKIRNVSPVKINEFRISSSLPANPTDSFIELYNAGDSDVDLSHWSFTERPTQQAISSTVAIPAGTRLAARHFYLLGLANSGLAVPARAGDTTLYLRSTTGMSAGDPVNLGTGSQAEAHTIAKLGTAATNQTTLWQPLPDGPVITIPPGATNVPVQSVSGFAVGQKIALGYGASYPYVGSGLEKYEVATVTAVGEPGTQAYLAVDAPAGASNIQVTSLSNISVGDKIRLDVDSMGHGIESVTVTRVGTKAIQTNMATAARPGATHIKVRRSEGFAVGDKISVGTPANQEQVTVVAVGAAGPGDPGIEIKPALAKAHGRDEWVVLPGTGLELAAPLKFTHAANLPFNDRGTGISFKPATALAHSSNEPVQALGTGITLDSPLAKDQAIYTAVRDAAVKTAGYQGTPEPNQWFGGPELTTTTLQFGRLTSVREGSMVLRDASGLVVDSVNYGGVVDPWAAEGYQATSGSQHNGCYSPAPGSATGAGVSAGRSEDGLDTDSNCTDFVEEAATALAAASPAGATNIKVATVKNLVAGQTIRIDGGANYETAIIQQVGTAGAATASAGTLAGETIIPVSSVSGFDADETVTIGSGADLETATIAEVTRWGKQSIAVSKPLTYAHQLGAQIAGSGLALTKALSHAHAADTPIAGNAATPGGPNQYVARGH